MMKVAIKRLVPPSTAGHEIFEFTASSILRSANLLLILVAFSALTDPQQVLAQGGQTLFGDVKIDSKGDTAAPSGVTIILYKAASGEVGRQSASNGGRYRFNNLSAGEYEIAIEADGIEVGRVSVSMLPGRLANSPYGFKQDLDFVWKPKPAAKSVVISAADVYERSSANKSLFKKAQDAVEKKKYDQSLIFLGQILDNDKLDFQVWTLLGTVYLIQEKYGDAEKAYLKALEIKPTFSMALLDLGRLRSLQKRFAEAIEPLTRYVGLRPESSEGNLLLGETYLQVKKGSMAISYLKEAARLGRPEAHLRLGWLYNAAGMKDKAAAEYEEFLKKRPDYPERNNLQAYIKANKKE